MNYLNYNTLKQMAFVSLIPMSTHCVQEHKTRHIACLSHFINLTSIQRIVVLVQSICRKTSPANEILIQRNEVGY